MLRMTFVMLYVLFAEKSISQHKPDTVEPPLFNVLVMFENKGHHVKFTDAAQVWLNNLAKEKRFAIKYITSTDSINELLLKKYQLIIQLDYVPYGWNKKAQDAFIKYMEQGWGGWIGLHHASLLGDFDGYKMWPWYYDFMGEIQFKNYIPEFANAVVNIEDSLHPVMKGLPRKFVIENEEWYVYDKSPRSKVNVLASVDEATYFPDSPVKMGDHPVIWSNKKIAAKNIYIFMGHSPQLLFNKNFTTLFENAIMWAHQ